MTGIEWLNEIHARVVQRFADLQASRPEPETLGLSRGLRTVVIHVDGRQAWLAPSFAAGGTLGSRLQDRVQHLDIQQYAVAEATVDVARDAAVAHLK